MRDEGEMKGYNEINRTYITKYFMSSTDGFGKRMEEEDVHEKKILGIGAASFIVKEKQKVTMTSKIQVERVKI